jgi:hypothetical protein
MSAVLTGENDGWGSQSAADERKNWVNPHGKGHGNGKPREKGGNQVRESGVLKQGEKIRAGSK